MATTETFWQKLGDEIKKIATTLWTDIGEFLVSDTAIALRIAQIVRTVLTNPVISFSLDLIPGMVGDIIRKEEPRFLSILGQAITLLAAEQGCVLEGGTTAEKVACFVRYLQSQPSIVQNALIYKLASVLLMLLDGGSQPESTYDADVQTAFTREKLLDGGAQSAKITYPQLFTGA